MKKYIITSEKQTQLFGSRLSEKLTPGSVIALTGELGAGKTTLAKAIAKGLGIHSPLTSPTFTIIHEYREGRLPFYHFDVYRLNNEEEMYELGYEEYFYGDGVSVIEWADLIEGLLPEDSIRIHIEFGNSENERIYTTEKLDMEGGDFSQ